MRTTTKAIEVGTFIKVANASSRRHSKGTVTRIFWPESGPVKQLEYRSDFDNSLRLAALADVHVPRKKRFNGKAATA